MAQKGRPKLYKCTDSEFRQIWLDLFVDSNGNKRSVREIIRNNEFLQATGYHRYDKLHNIVYVSEGSASYQLRKMGLTEEYVFHYHQNVTGRISSDVTEQEWTRKNNRNIPEDKVNIVDIETYYDRDKEKLVRCLRNMAKKVGYNTDDISRYGEREDILNFADDLRFIMYRDDVKLFSEEFRENYK